MEYFFIPGRLKSLSWVELDCVCRNILGSNFSLVDKRDYFVVKTSATADFVERIFSKLGGFLKYGAVLDSDMDFVNLVNSEKVVFGTRCSEHHLHSGFHSRAVQRPHVLPPVSSKDQLTRTEERTIVSGVER